MPSAYLFLLFSSSSKFWNEDILYPLRLPKNIDAKYDPEISKARYVFGTPLQTSWIARILLNENNVPNNVTDSFSTQFENAPLPC